jgi:hypothetical protein
MSEKIELVIDDKIIEVPNEVTIGIYQQLQQNPELYKDNQYQLISLFTKIPYPELKNLRKDQIDLIDMYLNSKIKNHDENQLVLTFSHNGVEYGLENNWGKLAWGAWIDFEVYSSGDNMFNNIHRIMAILYRPIVSKDKKSALKYTIEPYKSEDIETRAEIFKDVPVRFWIGSSSFFLQIVGIFIENIKVSLERETKMNKIIVKGWEILPKWIQRKLPLDSILISHTNLRKKTLPKSSKLKI